MGMMVIGVVSLLGIVGMVFLGVFPNYVAFLVLGMSILSFVHYAWDKRAAINGRRRTPENSLHVMSLLGGWPGALVAQHGLRHKNRKKSFQAAFWVAVAGNMALIWFLVAEDGLKRWL